MYGLIRVNWALGSYFCRCGSGVVDSTDDFVFVGKGYKIYRKKEIESSIGDYHNTTYNYTRKVLPPELLSRTVVRLTCESSAAYDGICYVYVVGTDHYRQKTWKEAQSVIEFLKPDVVFLESCPGKLQFLTRRVKVPTTAEMLEMWWKKGQDPLWILFKWFEAKLESRWEIRSSGDMRAGYEEAMKYGGKVILGDRPEEITQQRMLSKMSPWEYLYESRLFTIQEDLLKTAKDELDRVNLRTQEMNKRLPHYTEILVYERDRYMAAKLLKVARKHNSVVAVVGMGHLAGIQENWKQPVDMKQLVDTGDHTFTLDEFMRSIVSLFCLDQYMRAVHSLNQIIDKKVKHEMDQKCEQSGDVPT